MTDLYFKVLEKLCTWFINQKAKLEREYIKEKAQNRVMKASWAVEQDFSSCSGMLLSSIQISAAA